MTESVRTPRLMSGPRKRRVGRPVARGLTLLEMLLAIGLLVLLLGFMFGIYWSTLRARERGKSSVESTQLARVVAERIAREIRGAAANLSLLGPGIQGREHEIRLNTVVLPDRGLFQKRSITDKPLPAQSDMREIRYYLAYDPDDEIEYPDGTTAARNLGLVRREVKTLNQASTLGNRREEVDTDQLAPEVRYVRFRYFDGVDWVRRWELTGLPRQNTLPQAVELTVGYEPLPPEDPTEIDLENEEIDDIAEPEPYDAKKFTLVVRIPQADTFFGSRLVRAQTRLGQSSGLGGSLGGGGR